MVAHQANAETTITEHKHYFEISDPLMGKYPLRRDDRHINGFVADIIASPLGQRALDITQLSKAEEHVTIPGTHRFHRL